MESILNYLTGTLIGNGLLASLAVWCLGLFAKSSAYRKLREWLGKAAYKGGAALSGLATSKLGRPTWGPFETMLTDFAGFGVEQFLAGLRSDNVEKLEAQVERLEAVGSRTRADAIAAKLGKMEVGRAAERRQ